MITEGGAQFRRAIVVECRADVVMSLVRSSQSRGLGRVVALGCNLPKSDAVKFAAFMTVSEDVDNELLGMLTDSKSGNFDVAILGSHTIAAQRILRFLLLDRLLVPGGRLALDCKSYDSCSRGWKDLEGGDGIELYRLLLSIRDYSEVTVGENWISARKQGSHDQFRKFSKLFWMPGNELEEKEVESEGGLPIPTVGKSDSAMVAAPRSVRLNALKAVQVRGAIRNRAAFEGVVEFWVDYNLVGVCRSGEARTNPVVLGAGEHQFAVDSRDGANALWEFRGLASDVSTPAEELEATPENLAVITIAAYPSTKIYNNLRVLANSAQSFGYWLHVLASSEPYSHAKTKVAERARWVRKLPAHFKHILFVDSRDCLFARPIAELCALYNEHRRTSGGILIGAESPCFPINDKWWRERFPENGGLRWINSGMFMGSRSEVCDALAILLELHQRIATEDSRGLEDVLGMRVHALASEQVLWQIAQVKDLFPLVLDARSKIFANLNSASLIRFENNPYFEIPEGGPLAGRGRSIPAVLHFPGPQAHAAETWAKRLGILPRS